MGLRSGKLRGDRMKTENKIFVILMGVGSLLTTFILFSWTFLTAYFNPSKQVLVDINKYGEANVEFIFLSFMIIIVPISLFLLYKYMVEKEKKLE